MSLWCYITDITQTLILVLLFTALHATKQGFCCLKPYSSGCCLRCVNLLLMQSHWCYFSPVQGFYDVPLRSIQCTYCISTYMENTKSADVPWTSVSSILLCRIPHAWKQSDSRSWWTPSAGKQWFVKNWRKTYNVWFQSKSQSPYEGPGCTVTYSGCSTSKADNTQVIEVQLFVVQVKPRAAKHCCGQRGDFEEPVSHRRHCKRKREHDGEVLTDSDSVINQVKKCFIDW